MRAIFVENEGDAIARTNYWQTVYALNGFFFLTWSGSAARLLVPDQHVATLPEMTRAEHVVMSRGILHPEMQDAIELMFEDSSNAPFAVHMPAKLSDRSISGEVPGATLTVWRPQGPIATLLCNTRVVRKLPCMQRWRAAATG